MTLASGGDLGKDSSRDPFFSLGFVGKVRCGVVG